jgi:hypothetical protein
VKFRHLKKQKKGCSAEVVTPHLFALLSAEGAATHLLRKAPVALPSAALHRG